MKKLLFSLLACTLTATSFAQSMPTKKFIGHSWDLLAVNEKILADNIEALEKLPLDGISIRLSLTDDQGKRHNFTSAMTDGPWKREWLQKLCPPLQKVCGGKLKHNLITSFFAPRKRILWDDDAQWANAVNNLRHIAWLAKQCGARGLLLDPEDYPKSKQYTYMAEVDHGSYEENAILARKRGNQLMTAIASEYPDALVLSFWLISMNSSLYKNSFYDLKKIIKGKKDLWVPFIDGMLDVIPPEMIMVDATENAYRHNFETFDFYKSALGISRRAVYLLSPENQAKYRSQVQVGFGLYLDMYVNKPDSKWYFPELNGSRLNRLVANFTQAMEAADEYCWVYGEKYNWIKWNWPLKKKDAPTWDDMLPGIYREMSFIKDPAEFSKYLLEWQQKNLKEGKLVNLIQNPDCNPKAPGKTDTMQFSDWTAGTLPPGWSFWQYAKAGSFGLDATQGYGDNFSAKAEATGNSCFIVKTSVQEGATYVVESFAKGDAVPTMRVRWQFNNQWRVPDKDVIVNYNLDAENGWKRAVACARVPAGVNQLVILMGNALGVGEVCNFDRPAVYHYTEEDTKENQ